MNKAELINVIVEKYENPKKVTKKEVEAIVETMLDTIVETLKTGDKVQLIGFGTFEAKRRSAHEGVNPRTGEAISIAETVVPTFKAGKAFKDSVK